MQKLLVRTFFLVLLTLGFIQASSGQEIGKIPLPPPEMADVRPPQLTGSDPKPDDATKAILAAFDKYEVVGMGAAHGNQDLDDFILDLIRNPGLASKINDVVVECGNSLYQPTLDRYIAGDDVPLGEVRKVWRNTTQPMCGVSAFYEQLFPLVRRINQKLPPGKKLRVLGGDPPIDWTKAQDDHRQFMMRDPAIASVMKKEVLSKHRKALMFFGVGHLYHRGELEGDGTAVELYEKDYPGVTLVIADHEGFGNGSPFAQYNNELEARMASWPVPSLVRQMAGTWLADLLDKTYSSGNVFFGKGPGGKPLEPIPAEERRFSQMADAYLYLGPRDLLLSEPRPAETFLNKDYVAELQRRAAVMGGGPVWDEADPAKVSDRDYTPFWYDEMQKDLMPGKMQFFGPGSPAPEGQQR